MPVEKSTGSEEEKERNFDELRHGKTYRKTRRKHGAATAHRQMIAIALEAQRKGRANKGKRNKMRHKRSITKR